MDSPFRCYTCGEMSTLHPYRNCDTAVPHPTAHLKMAGSHEESTTITSVQVSGGPIVAASVETCFITAAPWVPADFVFFGGLLTVKPDKIIFKGEELKSAPEVYNGLMQTFGQYTPAVEALRRIREAGGNTSDWAVWAQKTAAWGMQTGYCPEVSKTPPPQKDKVDLTQLTLNIANVLCTESDLSNTASFNAALKIKKMIHEELVKQGVL